jgi:hypothetical protein
VGIRQLPDRVAQLGYEYDKYERPPKSGPGASKPVISPAAHRLLFTRNVRDTNIWRVQLGTGPRPVVDKLNAAMKSIAVSDEVKKRINNEGGDPLTSTPEEYAADIDREETKWSAIVKASGAKVD